VRINEPITNNEVMMSEKTMLISGTDPGGRITFGNQAFVDISGYSLEELIGAPHNVQRQQLRDRLRGIGIGGFLAHRSP